MVEGSGFENRRGFTPSEGSNPFASARIIEESAGTIGVSVAFVTTPRTKFWSRLWSRGFPRRIVSVGVAI